MNLKFGQITTLDVKIFARENGSTGYWKPLTFLRDFGIGVYLLEPYDPDKIPVLFVHGAVGTPAGWKKLVATMDRTKFQPPGTVTGSWQKGLKGLPRLFPAGMT